MSSHVLKCPPFLDSTAGGSALMTLWMLAIVHLNSQNRHGRQLRHHQDGALNNFGEFLCGPEEPV